MHHSSDEEQQQVVSSKSLLYQIQMSLVNHRPDLLALHLDVAALKYLPRLFRVSCPEAVRLKCWLALLL